jgi:hypothetical protein
MLDETNSSFIFFAIISASFKPCYLWKALLHRQKLLENSEWYYPKLG